MYWELLLSYSLALIRAISINEKMFSELYISNKQDVCYLKENRTANSQK